MTRGRAGARVLVGALVMLIGCSDDSGPPPTSATTVDAPGAAIDDLEPGTCLRAVPRRLSDRAEVVDCGEEHRAEVYATHELDAGAFPGVPAVNEDAALGCADRYGGYAGEPIDPTTNRAFAELVPSAPSWADGDRRVVCLALPPGGASETGSIADPAGPDTTTDP